MLFMLILERFSIPMQHIVDSITDSVSHVCTWWSKDTIIGHV